MSYGKDPTPQGKFRTHARALLSGMEVCGRISLLFQLMFDGKTENPHPVQIIGGYNKEYGQTAPDPDGHRWNAYYSPFNQQYKLIDCTWGMGSSTHEEFSPVWFSMSNEDFAITHLPTDAQHLHIYAPHLPPNVFWDAHATAFIIGCESLHVRVNNEQGNTLIVEPLCPHGHGQSSHFGSLYLTPCGRRRVEDSPTQAHYVFSYLYYPSTIPIPYEAVGKRWVVDITRAKQSRVPLKELEDRIFELWAATEKEKVGDNKFGGRDVFIEQELTQDGFNDVSRSIWTPVKIADWKV
jgi:hypothetical protein